VRTKRGEKEERRGEGRGGEKMGGREREIEKGRQASETPGERGRASETALTGRPPPSPPSQDDQRSREEARSCMHAAPVCLPYSTPIPPPM
jgi:hypothetical protein